MDTCIQMIIMEIQLMKGIHGIFGKVINGIDQQYLQPSWFSATKRNVKHLNVFDDELTKYVNMAISIVFCQIRP